MKGMVLSRTSLVLLIVLMLFAQLVFFQAAAYSVQLLPGDINGDGTVDIFDAITVVGKFGTSPQSLGWNPKADLNGDNIVDILDTVILAKNFGSTVAPLEEVAFEEGSLTIYGVIDQNDFNTIIKPAFEADYPWSTGMINYVGLPPYEISPRALSEYLAGHVQADVLINTLGSLMPALVGGVAENWTNPMITAMNYSNGTYDPNGQWDPGFGLPIVVVYNANLVPPSMVPTTWDNLTDPPWNGKIVIDDPKTINVAASVFADLYPRLGNATWTQLMNGLAANHPILTTSAGDAFTDVASGQASICIALINDYIAGVVQLPPHGIAIAPIQPVTFLAIPSVLCSNAPHPNFAKLFLEWFAQSSGQRAIAKTGRVPMHFATATDTILKGVLPAQITEMSAVAANNPDYYINPSIWSATYASIFG